MLLIIVDVPAAKAKAAKALKASKAPKASKAKWVYICEFYLHF